MKLLAHVFSSAFILGMLTACAPSSPELQGPYVAPSAMNQDSALVSQKVNTKVDMLFVEDNSLSMNRHQDRLAENVKEFTHAFIQTAQVDFHIGVTLIWDSEHFGPPRTCNPTGQLIQLSDYTTIDKNGKATRHLIDGPRYMTRDTPNLENVLHSSLMVGTLHVEEGGPEFEEMFSPVAQAFAPGCLASPTNAGFYRPDAHLVVIFVTDADDSTFISDANDQITKTTPDGLYDYLVALKGGDASMVTAIGALSPIDDPGCPMDESGKPFRMTHFINLMRGHVLDLCSHTYGSDLANIGAKISRAIRRQVIHLQSIPDVNSSFQVTYAGKTIPRGGENGWSYDPQHQDIIIGGNVNLDPKPGATIDVRAVPVSETSSHTQAFWKGANP